MTVVYNNDTRLVSLGAVVALTAATLAGCTIDRPNRGEPDPTRAAEAEDGGSLVYRDEELSHSDLRAIAKDVAAEAGQPVGIAISSSGDVRTGGTVAGGSAWSTIKVPISIAAMRSVEDDSQVSEDYVLDLVEQAITVSDNVAADSLWTVMGGDETAGPATQQVLDDTGDEDTEVERDVVRSGFSSWGQTDWALRDQARFAAALPELDGSEAVIDAMGRIAEDQSWGLGTIPGARFKGGWGPNDVDGAYEVRQLGFVESSCGVVGIALATAGGTFDEGQEALDLLAEEIAPVLRCGDDPPVRATGRGGSDNPGQAGATVDRPTTAPEADDAAEAAGPRPTW